MHDGLSIHMVKMGSDSISKPLINVLELSESQLLPGSMEEGQC